jgi:hypothetical protein
MQVNFGISLFFGESSFGTWGPFGSKVEAYVKLGETYASSSIVML